VLAIELEIEWAPENLWTSWGKKWSTETFVADVGFITYYEGHAVYIGTYYEGHAVYIGTYYEGHAVYVGTY